MTIKSDKLGPGVLTFGETASPSEWSSQITKCTVEPKTDTEDPVPVLSGEEIDGDDTDTAELTGTILQSYDLESLLKWSHDHHGETISFRFQPNRAAGLTVTGLVKIRRLAIGGDVKIRNTSDFAFPIVGDYDLGSDG